MLEAMERGQDYIFVWQNFSFAFALTELQWKTQTAIWLFSTYGSSLVRRNKEQIKNHPLWVVPNLLLVAGAGLEPATLWL
jgi:hypothetical protein